MHIEKWFNTQSIKRFYFPGRIFVGNGVFDHAVSLCEETDGPLAVVIDRAFSENPVVTGALAKLKNKPMHLKIVNGMPIAQEVLEFAETLGQPPKAVLAIGGGSVSDFAKAVVSHFLFGAIDGVGLGGNIQKARIAKPLLICVPTTAGSGAEASRYFVTYDRHDHHKMYGKSWDLVADWIMLEPTFLNSMPESILVACAFDAFVHLFETLVCRYERSSIGEMFSLDGIAQTMDAIDRAIYHGERSDDVHAKLMQSATIGGVAISNVRTGNIHEAAGALLELTQLSHPETLYVFFRDIIEQYHNEILDRETQLVAQLKQKKSFAHFKSLEDVIAWWEAVFRKVGLDKGIRDKLRLCTHPLDKVRNHVFQRVYSDKVWIGKESPLVLDEAAIYSFIDKSFGRFEVGAVKS